jgi:hypothetical protein
MSEGGDMRDDADSAVRLTGFLVFWYAAGVVLVVLGIAVLVTVHDGRRLGVFLIALGGCCALIAYALQRAGRGPE